MSLKPGITTKQLMVDLEAYQKEWLAVNEQLNRTPLWRFIRWHRLLWKLNRLTKNYSDKHFGEEK